MFSYFPQLPAEIRQLVWTFCLPDLEPRLFKYKKGFWQFRELSLDEREDPTDKTIHEFRLDLLDPVQIHSSVPQANREAYAIAIPWARRNHVQVNVSATGLPLSIVLSHKFRPELDILYVPIADLDDFVREPTLWMFDDYRIAQQDFSCTQVPQFRNLAVPLELWQSDNPFPGLEDTLEQDYPLLQTIMLVAGHSTDDIGGSKLDSLPSDRHGYSLVHCTPETQNDGQDLRQFRDYRTNAQKWWFSNNQHPKQLQFCSCHRS